MFKSGRRNEFGYLLRKGILAIIYKFVLYHLKNQPNERLQLMYFKAEQHACKTHEPGNAHCMIGFKSRLECHTRNSASDACEYKQEVLDFSFGLYSTAKIDIKRRCLKIVTHLYDGKGRLLYTVLKQGSQPKPD